ncbi:hypothetical protein HOK68_01200 [Candidatus Woesearchaeota archaeon]|jgi:hypothetical protein|nr:hypothetical protein [Candidatus Woesearchaeota archaeon]MBT4387265.1 hypothetical protein [Candidatus Woesearchaeota archaeon]MBT4596266.1 hypothetical protein [Candidatus Woesearchaeota archaeon]MBT5741511.1 hypothetical protein [Candidatus Woesearchaeota archaeon]MBT6505378.1 hypothetical protein [Candidatus Woesearchaeota archaeon]
MEKYEGRIETSKECGIFEGVDFTSICEFKKLYMMFESNIKGNGLWWKIKQYNPKKVTTISLLDEDMVDEIFLLTDYAQKGIEFESMTRRLKYMGFSANNDLSQIDEHINHLCKMIKKDDFVNIICGTPSREQLDYKVKFLETINGNSNCFLTSFYGTNNAKLALDKSLRDFDNSNFVQNSFLPYLVWR